MIVLKRTCPTAAGSPLSFSTFHGHMIGFPKIPLYPRRPPGKPLINLATGLNAEHYGQIVGRFRVHTLCKILNFHIICTEAGQYYSENHSGRSDATVRSL
jgi:hypothetical protein